MRIKHKRLERDMLITKWGSGLFEFSRNEVFSKCEKKTMSEGPASFHHR